MSGEIKTFIKGSEWKGMVPDKALSTEVYLLIEEQAITLAAPSEADATLWMNRFALEMPFLEGLKKVFFEESILSLPYKTTHIFIEGGSYTLVPNDLESTASPELWSSLLTPIEEQHILSQTISVEQMTLLYSVPLELYNFCQRSFSLPTYSHSMQPFISFATRLGRQSEPKLLMVRLGQSQMDVLYVADGVLQLSSRYEVKNDVDVLYFITAIWRQFYLSQESVPLYLYPYQSTIYSESLLEKLREHISRIEVNYFPATGMIDNILSKVINELPPEFILQLICA